MLSRDTIPDPSDTRWGETVLPDDGGVPRGAVALRQVDLETAVLAGVINRDQAETLWLRLASPDFAAHKASAQPLPMPSTPGGVLKPWLFGLGGLVVGALLAFLLR